MRLVFAPHRIVATVTKRWSRRPLLGEVHDVAQQALSLSLAALDAAGAEHWLTYGTLLGLVRDGGLIAYDTDIDLAVRTGADAGRIAAEMTARGFSPVLEERDRQGVTKLKFEFGPVLAELNIIRDGAPLWTDHSLAGRHSVVHLTHPPVEVIRRRIGGFDLPVPAATEAYLVHLYGPGWRQPVTNWHWIFSPPNAELHLGWRDIYWFYRQLRGWRRQRLRA